MNVSLRTVLALALAVTMPATTLASGGASSGGYSGGRAPSGGSSSGSARTSGRSTVRSGAGGFSFPRDINVRPMPVARPVRQSITTGSGSDRRTATYTRAPFSGGTSGGQYHANFHGPVVRNPHQWPNWGWNHGMAWYPAPLYWGGGFWGPFAIGGLTAALFYGSIIDYPDQMIYPSYQIVPESPGAQLLQNYGLQQTECGPPDLVVIWGPNDSVICAEPNDLVAAGNYQLDPTTLTIVSTNAP